MTLPAHFLSLHFAPSRFSCIQSVSVQANVSFDGSHKMTAIAHLLACSLLVSQVPTQDADSAEQSPAAPIVIDWIHANDFSMVGLRPGIYDYHTQCGFRHGFDFLLSRGIKQEYLSQGRLTPERLACRRLLFINLPSAEREPFLVSEVMAIRDYVKNGGSLLIVMDHSNCYFHSHRLKPLLAVFGIEAFTDTACDVPPHVIGQGHGWLAITRFSPHPITKGLTRLGCQTGGRLDPRYSVAWTSEDSWADEWKVELYGQSRDLGLYGDFQREDHEPSGPLGVVAAREFHKGRIVIVGDQNMWGDAFMNYADNYRLWLNTIAWLLRDSQLAEWKAYENWHSPRLAFYEPADMPRFGSCDDRDYYHLLCLLSRYYWTFANDRLDEPAELRIVADGKRKFSSDEIAKLTSYVHNGGKLIILPHIPEESDTNMEPSQRLVASLNLWMPRRSLRNTARSTRFPVVAASYS